MRPGAGDWRARSARSTNARAACDRAVAGGASSARRSSSSSPGTPAGAGAAPRDPPDAAARAARASLPLACRAVTAQPAAPARRVVIAEDEALIRLDLAEMLAEEGYDVVGQAGDGERPSSSPSSSGPTWSSSTSRCRVLDGIAAAERIAEQRIAPVVILTAFTQRDLVERARDAGAMAYLVKPFSKADLVPAIEMAVSRFAELHDARGRGRRPDRAAGDPQGGRPGQGRAPAAARADRARGVPLDPEDRDGPAALDAAGRRGRHHARTVRRRWRDRRPRRSHDRAR